MQEIRMKKKNKFLWKNEANKQTNKQPTSKGQQEQEQY